MSLKIIQTRTSKHEEIGTELFTGIIKEDGRSTAYATVVNDKGIYCDDTSEQLCTYFFVLTGPGLDDLE